MEGCGRAKAAALRALQIEDSAEAHASLGWATLHYDWDFFSAEREFQRAIQLNHATRPLISVRALFRSDGSF